MRRRWLTVVSLVAALSLIAAACGDDDSGDTTTAAPGTTAATTTAAPTTAAPTTAAPTTQGEGDVAFDVGVTPAPCGDAVNEGNGCIYLGVISDLTDGPFAAVAVPLTNAQSDFWAAVNADGGLDGWDVIISAENTFDAHYDPGQTVEGFEAIKDRILALAQSLGTPQTQAALPRYAEENVVAAPATWWSGWAFSDLDQGLVLESGAPYCFEAMNGMSFVNDMLQPGEGFTWALVRFPGDYGADYGNGAIAAAEALGLPAPAADIQQVPFSVGGDANGTIAELLGMNPLPNLIVIVTGPNEMATIVGGVFQGGHQQFKVLGAQPTWNVGLLGVQDLVPLLQAVLYVTGSTGPWAYDSDGHAAMRAAAEANGRDPNGGYTVGWYFQYPIRALLQQLIADGDLTRAHAAEVARSLTGVSYDGMFPDRDYTGEPNEQAVRSSFVYGVDPSAPDGLTPFTDRFTAEITAAYQLDEPCG